MSPVDATTTKSSINAPSLASKISDFFKPRSETQKSLGNEIKKNTDSNPNPPQPCNPPPVVRVPSDTSPQIFSIDPPPPPPEPKYWALKAVEIESRIADPEEEFLINPLEFEIQSVSRVTSPTGRVEYLITWKDGHTAEIPVSLIYNYIDEDTLEKLENEYFKDNRNPETIYDDDPDYPGGAPSGGTLAYEKGLFPGQNQSRLRLAPEERRIRMQMRLGDGAIKRRGRRPKSPNSSPGYRPTGRPPGRPAGRPPGRPAGRPPGRPTGRPPGRPTGKPRGRPSMRTKPTSVRKMGGLSYTEGDMERDRRLRLGASIAQVGELELQDEDEENEAEEEEEIEEDVEDMEEEEATTEDELAAQLAVNVSSPSREGTPMSVTSDPPQPTPIQLIIPPSDDDDSDGIGSPRGTSIIPSPGPGSSLKRKNPPSPNDAFSEKKFSLPFSPPRSKPPPPPNAKTFFSAAKPHRATHQLPITSMIKRFSSPTKPQTPENNNKISSIPPPRPPEFSRTDVVPRPSTSSSINSFATAPKTASVSSNGSAKGKQPEKHTKVNGNKPSTSATAKSRGSSPPALPSITLATPNKPSSSAWSKIPFTPVTASSFYGNGTKKSGTSSKQFAQPNSTDKPGYTKSKSTILTRYLPPAEEKRPPKSIRKPEISSRSDSPDDIQMCDPPPPKIPSGFNPGDYEDFLEEDYIVEKVLSFKREQGKKLYLVKWKGYPVDQCTWEPAENLVGNTKAVEEFERTRLRGG